MHLHRSNAQRYASAARDAHSRVYGGCAAEAAVSEASGPRVSGCIRAPLYFRPSPVAQLTSMCEQPDATGRVLARPVVIPGHTF